MYRESLQKKRKKIEEKISERKRKKNYNNKKRKKKINYRNFPPKMFKLFVFVFLIEVVKLL